MHEFLIGIASSKRPNGCRTVDYLHSLGFPKERIILSVQTQTDVEAYTQSGVRERVGTFLYRKASSAGENRNTILDAVPEGTRLVLMDDDIRAIEILDRSAKSGLVPITEKESFNKIMERGFSLASKHKTVCWGVYPVRNQYFMKPNYAPRNIVTTQVMGIVVGKQRFDDSLSTKEDYDFCCRVIRQYGSCIRLNYVTIDAPKSAGGCEEAWKDKQKAEIIADMLCVMYPDILRPNPKRRGEVLMACNKKGA